MIVPSAPEFRGTCILHAKRKSWHVSPPMRARRSWRVRMAWTSALFTSVFGGLCQTFAHAEGLQPWSAHALPELTLTDLDGTAHDLSRYRGRPIVVHFFATWCEPCRTELSALEDWHRSVRTGHTVVAVNVAEPPARVSKFLASDPVAFPVLLDSMRGATKAWGVDTLPTTFVIDATYTARLKIEGPLDWAHHDVRTKLQKIAEDHPLAPRSTPR